MKKIEEQEYQGDDLSSLNIRNCSYFVDGENDDIERFLFKHYLRTGIDEAGATVYYIYKKDKSIYGVQYYWDADYVVTIESIPPSESPKGLLKLLKEKN